MPQLDTWYRVGVHRGPNSILGIKLVCKRGPTRYQVSSWRANGRQLDTKYRVGVQTGPNSILGIELARIRAPTRYLVSSWCTYGPQLDTKYLVVSSWGTYLHQLDTKYLVVSSWGTYVHQLDTKYVPQLDTNFFFNFFQFFSDFFQTNRQKESQLDTKYRVDLKIPYFQVNSILGIELTFFFSFFLKKS